MAAVESRRPQPALRALPGRALTARPGGWREGVLAVAAFLLLSALFLWRPLLAGPRAVFLPNDIPFHYDYAWMRPAVPPTRNPVLSDVTLYYYPYVRYAISQLDRGRLPLWNPWILGGEPLYATAQAAIFDPVNLLTRPFGVALCWLLGAWLRLALAGLGTYGLLRALGRGPLAGCTAGIVFMYCGFLTVWLNYPVTGTAIWLPFVLWATLRLLQTGRASWLAALAFCLAAMFYAGHPETAFLIGLTALAYAIFLLVSTGRARGWAALGRGGVLLGMATGLGLLAGLGQVLPVLDLIRGSEIAAERGTALLAHHFTLAEAWIYSASLAAVTLVPNLSGTPTQGNYWYAPDLANFNEQVSYCGLLALALAGYGLLRWRSPQSTFFAGAAGLAWALLIHLPGADVLYRLPGVSLGAGVRPALVFSLGVAVLAGGGLETLLPAVPNPADLRRTARAWCAGFALVLGGVLALGLALGPGGWHPAWAAGLPHATVVALFARVPGALYWPFIFAFLGAGVLALLASGPARQRAWTIPAARVLLLAGLIAGGLTFGSAYNPVIPLTQNIPATPLTIWLAAHLGHDRLTGGPFVLNPNLGMVFGLRDLRGYEDLTPRQFITAFGSLPTLGGVTPRAGYNLTPADATRLDLAGVRYVLAVRRIRVAGRPRALVNRAQFPPVQVYENTAALPRAYGVYAAEALPDVAAVQARVASPDFDPHRIVLLEGGAPAPAAPPGTPPPHVRFLADEAEHIALAAGFARPGYLVLADTWAAGWEARVDGTPAPIRRANGVFRAVALPTGAHTITFDYRPPLVYNSLAVSLAALLAIAVLAVYDLRWPRRSAPAPGGRDAGPVEGLRI